MSLLSRLGSWLGLRSLENPRRPLDPWSQALGDTVEGSLSTSGVRVNLPKALTVAAFWRGVNLISRTVAKLPLGVYRHVHPGREPDHDHPADWLLGTQPCEWMTPFCWKQTLTGHVVTHGNAYAYVFRLASGRPSELLPLDPDRTYPVRENGRLWYVHELRDGELRRIDPADMLHVKGLGFDGLEGYGVLQKAKESLGLAIATVAYGSIFFRNSARPSVLIKHPGRLSPEARKNLRESWERMHQGLDNSHRTAILEEGADAVPVQITARDSQLLESRQFSLIDVANWLNLPPNRLGAQVSTSYGSLEQENQNLLDDGIDPWLVAWEEECEAKLLTTFQRERRTHAVAFDRFPLVRADFQQRGEFYVKSLTAGWISPDEVRAREGLNPMPGGLGRVYFRPTNLQAVGADPDGPDGPAVAPGAVLLDVPDLRQEGDWDCGPAAVQSVCQFFGRGPTTRRDYIDALGATAKDGTRPPAVLSLLSRLGLVATAAAGLEVSDLARFFGAGHPVLCPCRPEGTAASGHWVVVIGTGLGQVFLQDPATGRRMLSEEEWLAIWRDRDADGVGYERYGIAVGEELLPLSHAEPDGDEDDGPDDQGGGSPPDDDQGDRLRSACRAVLLDAVGRMVRRVGHAARRAAGSPARFLAWLDTLEAEHGGTVRQALLAPLEAWTTATGGPQWGTGGGDPPGLLASRLLGELRQGLLDASGRATAAGLAAEIEKHMAAVESGPDRFEAVKQLGVN